MSFVGLQEAYEVSVRLLVRELGFANLTVDVSRERDQSSAAASVKLAQNKKKLTEDKAIMERTRQLNHYDIALYARGKCFAYFASSMIRDI